jgi:hypothetical protein
MSFRFHGCAAVFIAGCLWAGMRINASAAGPGVFGQSTQSEAALMGIFYDLKQTQDHQHTNVDPLSYWKVLDEFFSKQWDDAVLDRYYRGSKPLYTTQVFIPNMNANLAPKAFGADPSVKPSRWIIHYKAQISPPENGTYRFVGGADDLLAVAVNGKTELISPLGSLAPKVFPMTGWSASEPRDGLLTKGDWVEMKKAEIIDLDLIIGERPGGNFNAFLMIEKQGVVYAKDKHNHEMLPVFQVAAFDTPRPTGNTPSFATGFPPWISYQ